MKQDKPTKKAAKAAPTKASAAKAAQAKAAKSAAAPKGAVTKATSVAKSTAGAGAKATAAKAVKADKPAKAAKTTTTAKPATAPKAARKAPQTAPLTTFVAQTEIGWGNSLYLRGEGAPELSWERGILMKWDEGSWVYSTTGAKGPVSFKFLVNDEIWASGHNEHVEAGNTSITTPSFHY